MMEGVDVSKYQGTIDWNKVKASGMGFAMVRQGWINSDGSITEDPFYRQNMAGAHAAGLHTGVYLYSYATNESAMKAAASACVAMLEGFVCDMPIALDFEHATLYKKFSRAANASLCAAFLSRVEELGRYCILYTYKSFAAAYLDMSALSRYDFWLAHYTARTDYTGPYGMWQYTSSGSVPGISGRVDCNHAYKDYPAIITGKKEESDSMSDMLKVGPVSGGDRKTLAALADSLGLPHEDAGDYLIIGPASAGDRKAIAAKAAALAVGCVEYTAPEPKPEPEPEPAPEPTPTPDDSKSDATACTEQLGRIEAKLDKLLGLVNPALLEG